MKTTKMKFVIVYLLIGVVFAHNVYESLNALEAKYGPLRFSSNYDDDFKCQPGQSGPVCSNNTDACQQYFICIPGIEVPLVGKCNGTQTCNDGKCSDTPSALCEYKGLKFTCAQEGVFPEPSSCKKYNYCVLSGTTINANNRECTGDFAYNPVTTLCDKPLPSKTCTSADKVIPTCKALGQTEALKTTASYYYICAPHADNATVLYPNIYRCPNNQKYIGNYMCK